MEIKNINKLKSVCIFIIHVPFLKQGEILFWWINERYKNMKTKTVPDLYESNQLQIICNYVYSTDHITCQLFGDPLVPGCHLSVICWWVYDDGDDDDADAAVFLTFVLFQNLFSYTSDYIFFLVCYICNFL